MVVQDDLRGEDDVRRLPVRSTVAGEDRPAAVLAAAAGQLTPVEGAVLQEAIDVAVILNALRALRG